MISAVHSMGIIGAGKLGVVLAQLALKAGYKVYIAGSGGAEKIQLSISVLTPGALAVTAEEVALKSDVVILALPLGGFRTLPKIALAGKLVIDAMNYWWEVDGSRDDIVDSNTPSSQAVQDFLSESRVVKALNHMGYHHLHDEHKPRGARGRKAIAIAGDNADDIKTVATLVDTLGFNPVTIGSLKTSGSLEPGSDAFGASIDAAALHKLIYDYQKIS